MADGSTTNLFVPADLKARIEGQADVDQRPYKKELIVLLGEAVERREKRQPAAPRLPNRGDRE